MPDNNAGDLDSTVRAGIERLRSDRAHGASWLSRKAARLLAMLTSDVSEDELQQRLALVHAAARELAQARPSMAALANTVARIWQAGSVGASSVAGREAIVQLQQIHAEADRLMAAWSTAAEQIAGYARPLLGATVYTFSRSGTVETALVRRTKDELAQDEGEPRLRRVIVSESRPGGEGIAAAKALAAAGLDITLAPDAAMGAFVGEASAVVLGADSIRADGSVVNKVGSYPLALVAREAGVPVYVLAETLKIASPDFPLVFEPLEWPEMPPPPAPGVELRSVGFELVAAHLITAVVSEAGVLDRAQIAERSREAGSALALLFSAKVE
jgi:translation initiation factor 2B subunit (eIF-2B alpha/beta/delta family)